MSKSNCSRIRLYKNTVSVVLFCCMISETMYRRVLIIFVSTDYVSFFFAHLLFDATTFGVFYVGDVIVVGASSEDGNVVALGSGASVALLRGTACGTTASMGGTTVSVSVSVGFPFNFYNSSIGLCIYCSKYYF